MKLNPVHKPLPKDKDNLEKIQNNHDGEETSICRMAVGERKWNV